jgi:Zn-dependent peptidase ImmA (M78 family)
MGWSDRRAFLEARGLRHDLGLTPDQPADPFEIAARRGIEVVHLAVGEDDPVEGAFLRRDGRDFILVNSAKRGRRQRFTCAHEIGHAVLLEPTEDVEFVDTAEQLDLAKAATAEEREANLFAAELLMPEVGIRQLVAGIEDPQDAAGAIARIYNVSPTSAAIRLNELTLLDKATTAGLLETIDKDWREFWRTQQIPRDPRRSGSLGLPKRFRQRADELLAADVISPERHAELLDRPLQDRA